MANIKIDSDNEAKYNRYLDSLITKNSDIKNNFTKFTPDFTSTSNCFNDAKDLITAMIKFNKDNGNISYNNKDSDVYFQRTFLSLLLPFDSYTSVDNGKLIGESGNCKFTIADVKNSINNEDERIFIKVIEDPINRYVDKDYLIYDVISSIIFDKIFSENQELKGNCEKYIPVYRGCFCSYNLERGSDKYWNYNEIKEFKTIDKSPYNYKTILNVRPTDGFNMIYKEPVLNIMYKAIKSPISVWDIFVKNNDDSTLLLAIFTKSCDLYNFIKEIGLKYGFMHNDLHMSNILYDQTSEELVLIDFGRSSFGKYIDEQDIDLVNKIRVEYQKLYYDTYFPVNINRSPYLNSNLLKEFLYTEQRYFKYAYSTKLNNKYFGVILDLITFSLNLYIRLMYYLMTYYNSFYENEFKPQFEKLIEVEYFIIDPSVLLNNGHDSINITVTTVDKLVSNYAEVKNFIDTKVNGNAKNIFNIISEGLFYTGLYILFIGSANIQDRIYPCFQILDDVPDIDKFKDYVQTNVLDKEDYKTIINKDSFLENFLSNPTTGGESQIIRESFLNIIDHKQKEKPFSLVGNSKRTSKSDKIITLKKTADAYKKVFNKNYDLLSPIKSYRTTGGAKKGGKRILKKY